MDSRIPMLLIQLDTRVSMEFLRGTQLLPGSPTTLLPIVFVILNIFVSLLVLFLFHKQHIHILTSRFLELSRGQKRSYPELEGVSCGGKGHAIFQRSFPLNFKKLDERLFNEFNHLRTLDSTVDQVLHSL